VEHRLATGYGARAAAWRRRTRRRVIALPALLVVAIRAVVLIVCGSNHRDAPSARRARDDLPEGPLYEVLEAARSADPAAAGARAADDRQPHVPAQRRAGGIDGCAAVRPRGQRAVDREHLRRQRTAVLQAAVAYDRASLSVAGALGYTKADYVVRHGRRLEPTDDPLPATRDQNLREARRDHSPRRKVSTDVGSSTGDPAAPQLPACTAGDLAAVARLIARQAGTLQVPERQMSDISSRA